MFDDGSLTLSPDGHVLAVPCNDGVHLTDRSQGRELGGLAGRIAALFDREVWMAADSVLRRYSLAREPTWDPERASRSMTGELALPAGHGSRIAYGGPAMLWQSARPALIDVRDGALALAPLGFECARGDRLVALSAYRFVRARRGELALLDATGQTRWRFDVGASTDVLATAPLFEGRWIAAVTGRPNAREQHVVLVDARDGRAQHRIALRDVTAARFTPLRGIAVLRAEANHLLIVDLRFGKVLRHHEEATPIADFAIDDSGQRLVIQRAGGTLVDASLADIIAGRTVVAREPDNMETAGCEPDSMGTVPISGGTEMGTVPISGGSRTEMGTVPMSGGEPDSRVAPVAPVGPLEVPALLALAPRSSRPACSADEITSLLEARRALVAALAARAIALGWDTGSIAFVDEERPPFETEVAAVVLGVQGLASVQLRRTEAAVEAATRRLAAIEAALGDRVDPFGALADELGLDLLERRIALLVAAPALWGELGRLYGILSNDDRRAMCDEQLLVQLCGAGEREAIGRALDRDRPLVRHGILHIAGDRARPYATIASEPIVLRMLRGEPLDTDLDRGVELAAIAPPLDELRVPRAPLQRLISALARPSTAARVVLRGRIGSGRRTLASALAVAAGRRIGVIDGAPYARDQRWGQLAGVLRRTALRGWVPLVDGLDLADATTLELLRDHPGPLALRVAPDSTRQLPASFLHLELPALAIGECAEHWRTRLAAYGLAVDDVDTLAARFRVGPGVIDRCLADVGESREVAMIEHAMRQQLASRLGEVATRVERLPTWSQVVLPDDIQDSVLELIARIRCARTVYDTWGFDEIVTTARGVTAMFQGPPGTGKTLVAGAIANELGLDLYRIDVSRVMSKWIGETEQNLAKVFAAAEESQAILLFDEADSLFAKRTEVKSSNDRYANTEVNYLLQRLDSFEGIAILTTNFGSSIDAAFKRRLSFRLTFPFPDDDTREQLWKAHLPTRLPRAETIDLAALARRFRMSGGYIRNAALRAAFLAAEERSILTQDHLERAIRAEYREIGNLADSGVLA